MVALVFITSLAGLVFEVLLSRIFSISLSYHFAAMIVSIAMLGLAAGGVLGAFHPRLLGCDTIGIHTLAFGVSMPVSVLIVNRLPFDPVRLAWDKTEIFRLGAQCLVLAIPFICAGLVILSAFSRMKTRSGVVYGADLLGAAMGSMGALFLMSRMAPERGVLILAVLVLCTAAAGLAGGWRLFASLLAIGSLWLLWLQPEFGELRLSPWKGLQSALHYPGARHIRTYHSPFARIDTFSSPAVRFAPGLSLTFRGKLPEQIGMAVDGGETTAMTAGDREQDLAFLRHLPAALPYEIRARNKVLAIDPGGGLPMLLARSYGAGEIRGIETNPLLARVIREDYARFTDRIHEKVATGSGRTVLMHRLERFDLIDLSLQGTQPGGSFGAAEDYRLTVEAFREYLSHLEDNGVLCINLFILPPPRIELRAAVTAALTLEELGVRDASRHLLVLRSWGSLCLLVKRTPFTEAELASARGFSAMERFDLAYGPGIGAEESNVHIRMPSTAYFSAFSALIDPLRRDAFLREYIFDVRPVRDDAPYFHNFMRLAKLPEIYRAMGGKWQFFMEEGYLLPALLLQVGVLSGMLILLPAWGWRRSGRTHAERAVRVDPKRSRSAPSLPKRWWVLPYFGFIGIAFMFVEIALIQKLILPLEHPSHAVSVVLAALLAGAGSGGLLSQRIEWLRRPVVLCGTGLAVILYGSLAAAAPALLAPLPTAARFLAIWIALFPLGLLMGIPFPSGIRRLGVEGDTRLIPWAWVVNGTLSVLAPLAAVTLAAATGFRIVFLLAAGAYFAAFVTWHAAAPGMRSRYLPPA